MQVLDEKDFLHWAASHGITTYRPNNVESGLIFEGNGSDSRFWEFPPARELAYFFSHALAGLGEWSKLYLWPRCGHWPAQHSHSSPSDEVRNVLLRGTAIAGGQPGALIAVPSELPSILSLSFIAATFGGFVVDDLYLIPDRGHALFWIDHHHTLNGYFRDAADVEPFVSHMAAKEYFLPDELPDWTFKPPAWMDAGKDTK